MTFCLIEINREEAIIRLFQSTITSDYHQSRIYYLIITDFFDWVNSDVEIVRIHCIDFTSSYYELSDLSPSFKSIGFKTESIHGRG